jgi:hypothetical protein
MTGALTFHRPGEVAPRLAVSENLLRTLARAKKIPCVRLTGRKEIRFTDSQLQTIHQYLLDNGLVCAAPAVTRTSSDAEPALDENVPTALAAAAAPADRRPPDAWQQATAPGSVARDRQVVPSDDNDQPPHSRTAVARNSGGGVRDLVVHVLSGRRPSVA